MRKLNLKERLDNGGVVCAEGFLFEIERRGYMVSGDFVPEVVLEHPEVLTALHRDFQHAGSDVVLAFTYNGHREKMRLLGKEHMLEPLNRTALQIARSVAQTPVNGEMQNLLAGNISNTNLWDPQDKASVKEVRSMFDEMVSWASDEGVDYIIGETFYYAGEAFCALESIQASGLPAVVTIACMSGDTMRDGWSIVDTCKELAQRGATVVGMNCFRGPNTMMPYIRQIRKEVDTHVAAIPVAFRTHSKHQTFFNLPDESPHTYCDLPKERTFPTALDPLLVNRYEIRAFAQEAWDLGVKYLGVCCGAAPIYIREVAEAMGRTPPASRYREDISRQFLFGTDRRLKKHVQELANTA